MMKLIAAAHVKLMELRDEEDGQAYTEYGILLVIVAIGLIATLTAFKGDVSAAFGKLGDAIPTP
jgi:Flp pilus assembly pilin Flp